MTQAIAVVVGAEQFGTATAWMTKPRIGAHPPARQADSLTRRRRHQPF
jgi:hypothetical protein